MQTTNPKNLGAVAVTQRTPANHTSNHTKIHKDYKSGFDRAHLPDPSNYYAEQDLKLTGSGEWKNALCPFHEDSKPSLRAHIDTGCFRCMACGAKSGDVLSFHIQLYGLSFIAAAKALGAWRAKFSHLGIGDDLGGLSIIELWGLYGFLVRLE